MAEDKEKMTLDKLALMMGRGFNAVDGRLDKMDGRLDKMDGRLGSLETSVAVLEVDTKEVKLRLSKIEEKIADLVGTLDTFLKRLTDREEEFEIMKREMRIMKEVLKEKLSVDIDSLK